MSRTLFVLFLVLALFSISSHGQQCGVNEEFTNCGSSCDPICNAPPPTICTEECIIGCHCKDGYMKNLEGNCVLPEDC